MDAPKFCPYCGRTHENRGRACSDWCERKIRGWKQSVTGGRTRAVKRVLTEAQRQVKHRTRWRNVAMGRNAETELMRIFNVDELPK